MYSLSLSLITVLTLLSLKYLTKFCSRTFQPGPVAVFSHSIGPRKATNLSGYPCHVKTDCSTTENWNRWSLLSFTSSFCTRHSNIRISQFHNRFCRDRKSNPLLESSKVNTVAILQYRMNSQRVHLFYDNLHQFINILFF